jgi:uncharacterized protein
MLKNTLAIIVLTTFNFTYAASFDCNKAKSPVEKSICADSELSKLDEELSQIYKVAVIKYPVANYLKIRQREWIKGNSYCDINKFTSCLKEKYIERIKKLSDIDKIQVYSNTNMFSYEKGDAVAEIRREGNKYLISLWGGARIHRQAQSYTECEFEGIFSTADGGKATDKSGETFTFKIFGNKITYEDDRQNCPGFASLPKFLTLIQK